MTLINRFEVDYGIDAEWGRRPRIRWAPDHPGAVVACLKTEGGVERLELDRLGGKAESEWPFADLGDAPARLALEREGVPSAEEIEVRGQEAVWEAPLIGHPDPSHGAMPFVARRRVTVEPGDGRATLRVTAHGVYRATVNGRDVSDEVLAPGWTSYPQRLLFRDHDVTPLLKSGENVIEVEVAGGWYTEDFGHLDNLGYRYGEQPGVAARLDLLGPSGAVVETDETWEVGSGTLTYASIYHGETRDLRRVPQWAPAVPLGPVRAANAVGVPAVRRQQRLAPASIEELADGRIRVDLGQNIAGWLHLRVRGREGDVVIARHAEMLDDGELALRPLRRARAEDRWTLPDGESVLEPHHTYHGFRYAELTGLRREDLIDVSGVVVHSDLRRTGEFTTSHPLLNQLHRNIVWSTRSNFVSIPTDCPQRDERLGWTGDIQVFTPTAAFLYDVRAFLGSWLRDLELEQRALGGVVPTTVPDPILDIRTPTAAWGDAAVLVPWALYEAYGDVAVLERQFTSMVDWVEAVTRWCPDGIWDRGYQLGDWLDPAAPADDPGRSMTDLGLLATAYAYRSASTLERAARVLGRNEAAERAAARSAQVKRAFQRRYLTSDGRLVSDTASAYAMAIVFGLAPDDGIEQAMGARLAELVRSAGFRMTTGFLGTPVICDALLAVGEVDVMERLLLQTDSPSWLYQVTQGATTMWERWDSLRPDGTINPGEMTSFNHYALGSIADFLHRRIAGIAPAEPGYRRVLVQPVFLQGLEHAGAALDTAHGPVRVAWSRVDSERVRLTVEIPHAVEATVDLPGHGLVAEVAEGSHAWIVRAPRRSLDRRARLCGLDTEIAELREDGEAWDDVITTMSALAPELAERTHADRGVGTTLRDLVRYRSREIQASLAEAIDRLEVRRA
ncbi:hypothetical protein GCM10027416_06800 [Okibacterium endophyticum]